MSHPYFESPEDRYCILHGFTRDEGRDAAKRAQKGGAAAIRHCGKPLVYDAEGYWHCSNSCGAYVNTKGTYEEAQRLGSIYVPV